MPVTYNKNVNSVWNNKEWIFSGIGVFFLALLIGVLKRVWMLRSSRRRPPLRDTALAAETRSSNIALRSFSAAEIRERLEATPPLQVADVAKYYEGLDVEWHAVLFSAEKQGDDVRVGVKAGEPVKGEAPLVVFHVPFANNRALAVVHQGARLTVRGTISKVDTLLIYLRDVTLVLDS